MSEIKALEELREKLERDTSKAKLYPTAPIKHAFAEGVTIEGYRALADAIEAEIAERFMELPVDVDGVPIRVGDMIEYEVDEDTYRLHARGVYVYEDGHVAVMNERLGIWYPENCRHVKPRTLEDVLADYASKQHGITTEEHDELIAKYAAEIREILGVDE